MRHKIIPQANKRNENLPAPQLVKVYRKVAGLRGLVGVVIVHIAACLDTQCRYIDFLADAEVGRARLGLNHRCTFLLSFTGGSRTAVTFSILVYAAYSSCNFSISNAFSAFEMADFGTGAYRPLIPLTSVTIYVQREDGREVEAHPFSCFIKPKKYQYQSMIVAARTEIIYQRNICVSWSWCRLAPGLGFSDVTGSSRKCKVQRAWKSCEMTRTRSKMQPTLIHL
jgi:hypothetical protein